MRGRILTFCALVALAAGCDRLPGRPRRADRPLRPSQVMDFATLYGENCAGCHGTEGRPGGRSQTVAESVRAPSGPWTIAAA